MSVRAMLTINIIIYPLTKSVYFVLAYTQSDGKKLIFMEIPIGLLVKGGHVREWFVRLDKNLFGLKYSGLVWFVKLKEGMEAR